MGHSKLEKELDKALETYRQEIVFITETFDQSHYDGNVTIDDLEEISRQMFYCLLEFKNIIVKHFKENDR